MTDDIAKEHADWLLDAIACATQNRMFLRGDPECDEVACEAILLNGEKAINVAIARHSMQPAAQLDAAKRVSELVNELLNIAPSAGVYAEVKISPKMSRTKATSPGGEQ